MDFRAKLAGLVLEAKTKRIRTVPIHQQQILAPIAIDVQNLDRLDRAGVRDFFRLGERVIRGLNEQVNIVFPQQQKIGPPVAVQIAGSQSVGVEQTVIHRPSLWTAPAVGALVELHDQLLRLAVVGNVRPAISI